MSTTDRALAGLVGIIRRVMVTSKYYRLSEYQVVSSDGSTIDANPTDASAGLPPIQGYPLRYGIPGCSSTPIPGTVLAVAFLNPDLPTRRPVVMGAFDGTKPSVTSIDALVVNLAGGSFFLARGDWSVSLTGALNIFAGALATATTIGNVIAAGSALETALTDPEFPAPNTTKTLAT